MSTEHHVNKRRSARARGGSTDAVAVCAVVAICAAAMAGLAWTRPTMAASTLPYTQSGALTYSAPASANSVYGSAGLSTGEPIYGAVVRTVALRYSYQLKTDAPTAIQGTEQLVAKISNGQGLAHSISLQPTATPFTGDQFTVTATLDMATLRGAAAAFDQVGGNLSTGTYAVAIVPAVSLSGRVATTPMNASFDAPIIFSYTSGNLLPGGSGAAPGAAQGSPNLAVTASGAVNVPASKAASLLLGLSVSDVRIASLLLLLGAVVVGGLIGWPLLRNATSDDERARIAARYGSLIVEADGVAAHAAVVVVELDSFDGLLRVARRLECPILHWTDAGDVYVIVDSGTLYRCRTSGFTNHSGWNGPQVRADRSFAVVNPRAASGDGTVVINERGSSDHGAHA